MKTINRTITIITIVFLSFSCSNNSENKNLKMTNTSKVFGNVPNDFGAIVIKGNFIKNLDSVFNILGVKIESIDTLSTSFDTIINELNTVNNTKFVWKHDNLTIIEDFSSLILTNDSLMNELSTRLNTSAFSFNTSKAFSSFYFSYYKNRKNRKIVFMEGLLLKEEGNPLKEENFELKEGFDYEEIYGLIKELGYDWKKQDEIKEYYKVQFF